MEYDETAISCYQDLPQYFLICVTIHRAKDLSIPNASTFVSVKIGKEIKSTAKFKNSDCPHFNEYFTFELYCDIQQLLREHVSCSVYRKSKCCGKDELLGEAVIDFNLVWNMEDRAFFKKWVQLQRPNLSKIEKDNAGYLQMDLSIISKYGRPTPIVMEDKNTDEIEANMLDLADGNVMGDCTVRYFINIYKAEFVSKTTYAVQIKFGGQMAKTKQINDANPEWGEQISFVRQYPSLCQTFIIQILVGWNVIAQTDLNFEEMTFKNVETGNLPTFGPTYIHFYKPDSKYEYYGALLLSVDSDRQEMQGQRKPIQSSVSPLFEIDYWTTPNFNVFVTIFSLSRIESQMEKIKFRCRFGGVTSNELELPLVEYSIDGSKKYFMGYSSTYNYMQLQIKLPDLRMKYQIDLMFDEIIKDMKDKLHQFKSSEMHHIGDVAHLVQYLKVIIKYFIGKLSNPIDYMKMYSFHHITKWERNRMYYVDDFIENAIKTLKDLKDSLKKNQSVKTNVDDFIPGIVKGVHNIIRDIDNLISQRVQDRYPILIIESLNATKVTSMFSCDPKVYYYSNIKESCGHMCGRRHNIVLKHVSCKHTCENCGCIYGIADTMIWIGTDEEKFQWLPNEYRHKDNEIDCLNETIFTCNVYIHQGKVRPLRNPKNTNDFNGRLQVTIGHLQGTTNISDNSLSPFWNTGITFNNVTFPGLAKSFQDNPLLVSIDLLNASKRSPSEEHVGVVLFKPAIKLLSNTNYKTVSLRSLGTTDTNRINDDTSPLIEKSTTEITEDTNQKMRRKKFSKALTDIPKSAKEIRNRLHKKQINKILKELTNIFPKPLEWIPLTKNGLVTAEILVSTELIQLAIIESTADQNIAMTIKIPPEICPSIKRYKVEVAFGGLRNMKGIHFTKTIGKYMIELGFGDLYLRSGPSTKAYGNSINFLDPFKVGYVDLPEQPEYWPSIILKHIDASSSKNILVGAAMIPNSKKFQIDKIVDNSCTNVCCSPEDQNVEAKYSMTEAEPLLVLASPKNLSKNKSLFSLTRSLSKLSKISLRKRDSSQEKFEKMSNSLSEDFSWWTKYYNSRDKKSEDSVQKYKHSLQIYESELEKQPEFSYLQDWADSIMLQRKDIWKMKSQRNLLENHSYATLKCSVKVSQCPGEDDVNSKNVKESLNNRCNELMRLIVETSVVVRVYLVQAVNLRSHDTYGNSDSYAKIEYGKCKLINRAQFIPNQSNPIYGKSFQVDGILPKDQFLKVSLYDRDTCQYTDDLIGSTIIDIEDRLRSKHRAFATIQHEYNRTGYNLWRNIDPPSEILKQICLKHNLEPPVYFANKIQVAGKTFMDNTEISLDEPAKERLSLSVLKQLDTIPEIGYKLVPEHVESRSLYRHDRPGIEQGKILIWVEIFDPQRIPQAIDLAPAPPKLYELRCIIWNTKDVQLDEKNIFGTAMSDIYVKGWMAKDDNPQYTDIHYRSLNGEGNFNWRMVFPLLYSKSEDMMVVIKKKRFYEQFDTQLKLPTQLTVQIWDNDSFSADDFLGSITINISHFRKPSKTHEKCTISNQSEFVNLFHIGRIRGWFALKGEMKNKKEIGQTGKIELELEVLTEEEAHINPVGVGREGPNALSAPKRPDTSFQWFSNPLKTLKHIIKPQLKKLCIYCCMCICSFLLITLIGMTIYFEIIL